MWRDHLSTPLGVYEGFCEFLANPRGQALIAEHARYVHSSDEPCLLDIVALWLGFEDEILWIPSYEALLIGLVRIADDWVSEDKLTVNSNPLWRDPKSGEPRVVHSLLPRDADGTRLWDFVSQAGVEHKVLNRAVFDHAREVAVQRQHRNIQEQLARLLPDEHPK